jgi:hypothetical protein
MERIEPSYYSYLILHKARREEDPAIFRGRPAAMSKRSRSSGHCSDRPPKRPSKGQQQHLYVLLDDWESGCSIYRVDEDDFNTDPDAYPEMLGTESPIARIEARHPLSWSFATHGTNILAVRPSKGSPAMSGFDPQTMGVTLCPLSMNQSSILRPFYASVGDKLFVMVYPLLEVLGSRLPAAAGQQGALVLVSYQDRITLLVRRCHRFGAAPGRAHSFRVGQGVETG